MWIYGVNGRYRGVYFQSRVFYTMSVSDNSTIAPSSDIDGLCLSFDDNTRFRSPSNETSVAEKARRGRRSLGTAAAHLEHRLDSHESIQHDGIDAPQDGQEGNVTDSFERS